MVLCGDNITSALAHHFSATISILFRLWPDKPSAPQGPLEATDTTPTAITLQWKPPKDNGGAPISHYILEKKPKGSNKWQKVPGNISPNDTEATAKNLDEGEEYDFRVLAVNPQGESEPLMTTGPIKAKYPFGEKQSTCIWTLASCWSSVHALDSYFAFLRS